MFLNIYWEFITIIIILLPLFNFLIICFFGRRLGIYGIGILSITCMLLSVILSLLITVFFFNYLSNNIYKFQLENSLTALFWINVGEFRIHWILLFDNLTFVMLLVVIIISTLVHLYSFDYMYQDPHLPRFMSYLSLFTFFMLILITANNFLQLFLGWEGVGLCSYLLISFWNIRIQANKSAIKAMIINRVADVGLAISIVLIFDTFNSIDFNVVFCLAHKYVNETIAVFNYSIYTYTLICFLLFIGAMGKSAQIGLHTWLPDAMEGPTPVSALIHAATMVTAGVFVIIRCSPLFEYSPNVLCCMVIVGAMTAFFGAITGVMQYDIKKIIAYSTCSQLGYMIFSCGLSDYSTSLYHLTNHAFFKALLFLGSGAIIHAMANEQDIRKLGGLIHIIPYTYTVMFIGSLALIGFPFTSGFYSKDVILEVAHDIYVIPWKILLIFGLGTIICTSFYSTRLLYVSFFSIPNAYKAVIIKAHEMPMLMGISLFILSIGSIFSGYFLENFFIGVGSDTFKNVILVLPLDFKLIESEMLSTLILEKNSLLILHPLQFTLFGCLLALYRYVPVSILMYQYYNLLIFKWVSYIFNMFFFNYLKKTNIYLYFVFFYKQYKNFLIIINYISLQFISYKQFFFIFLNQKWFFDKIYNHIIGLFILREGYFVGILGLDKGCLELFGPTGLINMSYYFTISIKKAHSGYIWHYIGVALLSIFLITNIILVYNLY